MVPAELVSISTPLPNARRRHHSNCDLCEAESPGEVQMDVVPEKKRQLFWRNVVKQFNFTDQSERELLLSLTGGISWTHMRMLPKDFMRRHREIYYLISTPEYERSGAIGRDVTRTFSIFERSHQHQLAAQQSALFRVLNAIAEAEDGYCQGMNFIAALFLVEGLSEADAYALFLYMLKKRHLAGIYHRSSTFLDEYLQHFELMFIRDLPKLHAHMLAQGFAIPMYGIEWFTTLFSLSTKTDLACAIFDLFFVGVQDIFLRAGLAILKLLEAKLMCMTFEDFLREFKPLVRELDPYQVILQALALRPNPKMHREDTTAHVSRDHFIRTIGAVASSSSDAGASSSDSSSADGEEESASTLSGFGLHRTLSPDLADAIRSGNGTLVRQLFEDHVVRRHHSSTASVVLANEILHFAIWYGRVSVACLAIERCNADVDNRDDSGLTPLHFSVIRNQPDMVRLLLVHGARMQETSMRKLSPLELAHRWKRRDTTAARLVLEKEEVCLYCNTKFDVLALETAVCGRCEFRFCCKPQHALCIFKHQCPKVTHSGLGQDRRLSEPTLTVLNDFDDGVENNNEEEEALDSSKLGFSRSRGSSTSTSTSLSTYSRGGSAVMGMSRSVSETSSLEFLSSPAFLASPAMSWLGSPRFEIKFEDATSTTDPAQDQDADTTNIGRPPTRPISTRPLLEFPDRPEWYCNARECHSVFALFSQAVQCSRCDGYFCSEHVVGKTKHCFECRRDLVCSHRSFTTSTALQQP
ncbi:Ankyrin repeats (many copies) [Phytophthora infestans]|uniref:Ankyrin repeats (Many copies) n=1 Tax=Phytophthora infestans TaxID=4787 RepID=A0A833RNF4_PHYIN|nr:Ankyrin repeats (many copies) [Phytophthora infestans]KAF4135195.1 Ankyrin repeats (many copies) [Phytophthora infestans]